MDELDFILRLTKAVSITKPITTEINITLRL
jgi:hypothetical protein